MQKFKLYFTFLLITWSVTAWAQLVEYPVQRSHKTHAAPARIQAVTPMSLPFWDDFSFVTEDYPVDSLWVNNKQVLVSSGQGVNPPTINVATFDGLNENGIPYSPSPTDILDFGYRDTLESRPIKMTEVTVAFRNTVFLSFFFQGGGYGEPPDQQDFLRLEFKNNLGVWKEVMVLTAEEATNPTLFYDTIIRINQNEYYHDDFQFRFISFGRKSGRYDAWHIDYVYLNKGRNITDIAFPDRSHYTMLSPLFKEYYAVPQSHFKTNPTLHTGLTSFGLSNLAANDHPMNYSLEADITSFVNGVPSQQSVLLESATPILPTLLAFEKKMITVVTKPDLTGFTTADSLFVQMSLILETSDSINTGFEPVDFYVNDTIRQTYPLTNFYAYDDGEAEYAAGLLTLGDHMAYRFDMKTASQDTINGLFIYFPYFAGSVATTAEFFILDYVDGKPGNILYEEGIPITQTPNNKLVEIDLLEGVIVKDTFLIGYRQPSSGSLRIGLDKSNDTSDRMYYKPTAASEWQPSNSFTGSFMIRPRFGHGDVITGIPESKRTVSFYPNPNAGEFYVRGQVDKLQLFSSTGQPVQFSVEDFGEEKKVKVTASSPGLYIVRYKSGAGIFTDKIIVTK